MRGGLDAGGRRAETETATAKETEMALERTLVLALAAMAALAACAPGAPRPAPPVAPQPVPVPVTPEERLVAAIEAQNCVLTAQNVEAILLDASLTQADLVSLTPQLAAQGRAEVAAEGTIRVLTQNCI
jgi:hypothetical protein